MTQLSSFDIKISELFSLFFFDIHLLSVYFITITKQKNNNKKIINFCIAFLVFPECKIAKK